VLAEDEAGPYQAVPQPGPSWQPEGEPAKQPHEYIRGGTAKMLTLFRPHTGELRAQPVERTTNEVLHPWLQEQLTDVLAGLPEAEMGTEDLWGRRLSDWGILDAQARGLDEIVVRLLVVLDNLSGHHTPSFVEWCHRRGIVLLYTPIGGSWLNMAESIQRIVVRRALAGQHPENGEQIMDWLSATVRGWNADPTPFEWGGKRAARRRRAKERRALGGSGAYTRRPIRRASRRTVGQIADIVTSRDK